MKTIINLALSAFAVIVAAELLPGVTVDGIFPALIVVVVLGAVNLFIKPIIQLLALPINLFTFGLFNFVINALMILLVDFIVGGFTVDNFLWALVFGFVLSVINAVLHSLTK